MKGRFFPYLRLMLRRAARAIPSALGVAALLLLAVGLLGLARSEDRAGEEGRQRVRVGVAGDLENRWLRLGLEALEQMDLSRFELSLEPMEEAEARRGLRAGTLEACLVVPEGFVEDLAAGRDTEPLRFVTAAGGGVVQSLTEEVARSVAGLLLETEGSVYAFQDYVAENLPELDPYAQGDRLVFEYLSAILARGDLFVLELTGLGEGLGFREYWAAALALLLVLLWGLALAPLCTGERHLQRRVLLSSGLGAAGQVLAEYLACLCLAALPVLGLYPAAAAAARLAPALDWLRETVGVLLPRLLYVLLPVCAGQLLLYELAPHPVGGLLLQFLAAAGMGYLSGCFYPRSFLPEGAAALGGLLPTGAALDYLGAPTPVRALTLAAWAAALLLLSALLRRRGLRSPG